MFIDLLFTQKNKLFQLINQLPLEKNSRVMPKHFKIQLFFKKIP